jgi:hypothetical protein
MARDTVVLSPEFNGCGRREAPAVGSAILTGAFVEYTTGGVKVATAAVAASMLAVENISTAQDTNYEYAIGENVFCQAVPRGALANVKAVDATYDPGDQVEIGAGGEVTALAAGVAVGVVPSFGGEVITGTASLMIQLL